MIFNRITMLSALASVTIFNSLAAEALISSEIEAASKLLGANLVNEFTFDEGKTTLDEQTRAEVRSFIKEASKRGEITEVKVAVWADKEYSTEPTREQPADVKLSEARARSMRDYLTQDLALKNVSSYNMSERPNPLFKNIKVSRGTASESYSMNNDYIFTRVNKSKAVIMIYLR
ncbi:OmpA family protein [Bdellovibrio svalbardensis]|uniref:OmpA family protein n=1 Tax=Bdellovibrio svalbardensis TaxID=2972972 RepID=A0ABT6DIK1_9BACT|nr:OmpA family protein [Bdellovibrio svalbardensis]MDG0815686.1 OmpA family protein [Bdellovibrio svalbardensis]